MLIPFSVSAQKKFTVSGYVKDARNGETLIGATVLVKGQTKGISTNSFGFYSLTLTQGNYTLVCSYTGYQSLSNEVKLTEDKQLTFELAVRTAM